jgi:tRNA A37 methylthiotransferase MiaB
MAIFTESDRDAIKTAIITAATEGIAEVTIGGQQTRAYSLDELRKLLEVVQADLAGEYTSGGIRFVKTIPPAAG